MLRGKEISDRQLSEVIWMYYIDDLSQGEIAKKLSVSRPTVLSYLKQAKERRLFEIRLQPGHFKVHQLSSKLRTRFKLTDVHIVDEPDLAGGDLLKAVCTAAGYVLADSLRPGDQLGVSCGETVSLVSKFMPVHTVENVVVRQLIGSLANPVVQSAEACTLEIARKLSGHCVTLVAPAICSNADLATALKREPIIQQQLAELRQCNKAVLSLSPCDLSMAAYTLGVSSTQAIGDYRARGAVGSMAMRFMNAAGQPVLGILDDRMIGITLIELKEIADILLVVCGLEKVVPTLAALRGGSINRLVIDHAAATSLLAKDAET
ncbi:sugar-binding transcriptional regulator [Acetobacteraceae bacterium]|nr:sugar-binding transcriptional regulator [Acetobacteraceae bacterium]